MYPRQRSERSHPIASIFVVVFSLVALFSVFLLWSGLPGARAEEPEPGSAKTVTAGTIEFLFLNPVVGSGLSSGYQVVNLSEPLPAGGTLRIESSNPGLALVSADSETPGTPYIEASGVSFLIFFVHGLEGATGSVDIVVTATGFTTEVATLLIVRPAIRLSGLGSSLETSQPDDYFVVDVGIPDSTGENLSPRTIRPGGDAIHVTVANLENSVGELVTSTVVDQTVSVEIPVGQYRTVAPLGFRPTAAGSTFVAATSPVCFSTAAATKRVVVTQSSLSITGLPATVGSGLQLGGLSVELSAPEHGGVTVHLESSDSTVVLVSPDDTTSGASSIDLFIPNGSTTSGDFWIQGMEGVVDSAYVTASAPGFVQGEGLVHVEQGQLRICCLPSALNLVDSPWGFKVYAGMPASGNHVRVGGPPLEVSVSTSQPSVGLLVSPPDSGAVVTAKIAPGDYGSNEILFYPASEGTTTVTASAPNFITAAGGTKEVEVTPIDLSLQGLPIDLAAGCQEPGTAVKLSTANHGGVNVHIESSDSTICLVSPDDTTAGTSSIDIFIPDGSNHAKFCVQGLEGARGKAAITASASGLVAAVDTTTLVQGAVQFGGYIPRTIETGYRSVEISVAFGTPNSTGSYLTDYFGPRAGGPGLSVTVSSSVGSVGSLESPSDSGSVVTVHVSPGKYRTEFIDFIPVAPGTTVVSTSVPDFITTSQGVKEVFVVPSTLDLILSGPPRQGQIGSGLQRGENKVRVSTWRHGGVNVHLESADSSICLVSPDATTPGTPSIDLFLQVNRQEASFYIQGLEGVTGKAAISASVPGFTGDVDSAIVLEPAVRLSPTLPDAIGLSSPPVSFVAWTGIPTFPSPDAGYLVEQSVRAGGAPLTVTASSSDSLAGILWAPADSGGVVTVSVAAGEQASDTLKFVPVAPGTTVVMVAVPGFYTILPGSQEIRVTELSVSLSNFPAQIGAGLQQDGFHAELSPVDHGGTTIHLESEDSTLFLISPDPSAPGVPAFDVFVANGETVVDFVVHGLEGVTGQAYMLASVPGVSLDSGLVEVVPPGLDISGLGLGTDLNNPTDQFTVRTGLPKASGSGLRRTQAVRTGAPDLTVTVTHSDTAVAELVSLSLTGHTVTTSIASGFDESPDSVAWGGVGFSPVATGTTYVSASAPGFLTTGAGSQRVFILNMLTAVSVESHAAYWSEDHVVVEWRLSEASEESWFEVYRLEQSVDGEDGRTPPLEAFTRLRSPEIARDGNHFILRDPDVERGRSYVYRVLVYETDGSTASFESTVRIPGLALVLYPNKPNPFNPTTRISFELPSAEAVSLRVYDLQGRLVRTLLQGFTPSGLREVVWDGTNDRGQAVGSGVYFYRLKAGKESLMRKMVLLK